MERLVHPILRLSASICGLRFRLLTTKHLFSIILFSERTELKQTPIPNLPHTGDAMSAQKTQWVNAVPLESVPPGQARAVRLGRERSIALFNEGDKIYATDNQCPHMGYPLVRGVVRHGVLTCDWHGPQLRLAGRRLFQPRVRRFADLCRGGARARYLGRSARAELPAARGTSEPLVGGPVELRPLDPNPRPSPYCCAATCPKTTSWSWSCAT